MLNSRKFSLILETKLKDLDRNFEQEVQKQRDIHREASCKFSDDFFVAYMEISERLKVQENSLEVLLEGDFIGEYTIFGWMEANPGKSLAVTSIIEELKSQGKKPYIILDQVGLVPKGVWVKCDFQSQ